MIKATLILKKVLNWVLAYNFSGLVHYYHDEVHGEGLVWCSESSRELHPDWIVGGGANTWAYSGHYHLNHYTWHTIILIPNYWTFKIILTGSWSFICGDTWNETVISLDCYNINRNFLFTKWVSCLESWHTFYLPLH